MKTYNRFPLSFTRGEGMYLFTEKGEKYLDFSSGIAVNSLGHCNRKIVKTIEAQARKLIHVSNLYRIFEQETLAKLLAKITGYDACFFCNSGTESMEAALKLARKATGKKNFISFEYSFHGRTLGALSVTGKESIKRDFGPLISETTIIPWEDEKVLEAELQKKTTAAVIFEFIQGEGGVRVMSSVFAHKIFTLAKKYGALTIADEIQTGIGRTGTFLASEHYSVRPDIVTLAKGLGGGVPIGAILAKNSIAAAFSPGSHGSTFGGNPFCCAVAATVVREISKKDFLKHICTNGTYFLDQLRKLQTKFPQLIVAVRGKGLLIGIEMQTVELRNTLIYGLQKKYILVTSAGEKVVRLLPPLIVDRKEIILFIVNLHSALTTIA